MLQRTVIQFSHCTCSYHCSYRITLIVNNVLLLFPAEVGLVPGTTTEGVLVPRATIARGGPGRAIAESAEVATKAHARRRLDGASGG